MGLQEIMSLIGGLALFLFGMNVMGSSLQKSAGSRLKSILQKMTSNTFRGFLLGVGTTVVMQSSSATTVMVVGFVNSGIMTLRQSIGVIIGANLGATITPWLLSLTGISGNSLWLQIIKPSTFVPVLALIGVILLIFQKNAKRRDVGMVLLGFATLMFGMEMMSGSVVGLRGDPQFIRILTLFTNPILGVLVGIVFTAIVQSSSASIGILQALSSSGGITYAAAVPIVMGQNIGTCVSAMISSVGTSKNARRAAIIHLSFNVIATLIFLPLFWIGTKVFPLDIIGKEAGPVGIALVNTAFKVLALVLMPFSAQFESLSRFIVRDRTDEEDHVELLDERLMKTPSIAIDACRNVTVAMAETSVTAFIDSVHLIESYDEKIEEGVREAEAKVDIYEDKIGTYLVGLSARSMTKKDSGEATKLLRLIGDFERISDHAVNICESVDEMRDKKITLSGDAMRDLLPLIGAVDEILTMTLHTFIFGDLATAVKVEPLEQVVDHLCDKIKGRHIARMQKGECTMELGFVLTDLLTSFERVSDHCSNVAACVLEMEHNVMDVHEYLRGVKEEGKNDFGDYYNQFKKKYAL